MRPREESPVNAEMPTVLIQLGELFLGSVPTVIIFLLLHAALRRVLYRPLQEALRERKELTEGRFEVAREQIALAEEKLAEYEHRLREARAEMFTIVEDRRRAALAARTQLMAEARARADAARREAEIRLAEDLATARKQLEGEAAGLVEPILTAVLGRTGRASLSQLQPGVGA